jgi:hypothetical protein
LRDAFTKNHSISREVTGFWLPVIRGCGVRGI